MPLTADDVSASNSSAFLLAGAVTALFCARVGGEKAMLVGTCGGEYRKYMKRTNVGLRAADNPSKRLRPTPWLCGFTQYTNCILFGP